MRKFLSVFFVGIFLLLLGLTTGSVSAFAFDLIDTPTLIPPSVTPTIFSADCPDTTPVGWLTYTPSPLWLLDCGDCGIIQPSATVTNTPLPTFTLGPGTPSVTPTITTTPTVTATATSTAFACSVFNYPMVAAYRGDPGFTLISNNDTSTTINRVYSVSFYGDYYENWNNYKWFILDYIGSDSDHAGLPSFRLKRELISGENVTMHEWWGVWYDVSQIGGGIDVRITPVNTAHVPVNATFRVIVEPALSVQCPPTELPIITVTPTVTPVIDDAYCSSVAPISDVFGWDLFEDDGSPNCDIGWKQFGFLEYTVPSVVICLQPSKFGVVRLFGEDYEVGIYGLIAAAAFFYRFLRTI